MKALANPVCGLPLKVGWEVLAASVSMDNDLV